MKRPNLDHTLTELAALKKSVRAAEQKTIDFVRSKVEKLLVDFDFGPESTYFTEDDVGITLHDGGIGVRINVLRYKHRPGEPETFVESEDLENSPTWAWRFKTELAELLGLKKHDIAMFINPSLFPK